MTESTRAPLIRPAHVPTVTGMLKALLQADFLSQLRNGRGLLLTFLLPLILLYGLNAGKRGAVLGGPTFRVALALTLGIASMAILGYTNLVARDRENGVFQRLRVTPAPTWSIMGSRLTVQVVAILVMMAVVLIAAFLFQNINFGVGAYALTVLAVICASAVFLSVGQALVGLITSTDTINAVGRVVYLPLVALGLFAHSTVFGTTIETIARWSPAGVVSSLLIGAMEPSSWTSDTWWSLLVCGAYAVIFATIGIRYFRWTTR